jgi:iron complex outermembrane receptor protein
MYTLPETQRLTASLNLSHQWIINSRYALSIFTGIENNTYELLHESGREQMEVLGYHAASSRNFLMLNGAIKLTRYYAGNIDLSASIGYTERAPVFNEMFGFYLFNRFDGYDYTGNPGLKPEKSLQSEITLHYIPGYGTVTITVYYNHINNYVSGSIDPALSVMTAGARGVKHFSNLPYADMYGAEASLLLKVNKYIDVFSGIKYSAGKDNNSEPLALIPPLSVLASVKYSPGALSFIAETDYSAKQANVRSTSGERQTPSYILLNSRLSYKMNFTGTPVVISTGVENILNSRYRDHLDWGNILRPGRNFYLSFMLLYNGKNSMN